MLNQVITILVLSTISCIGGWYLGARSQRRVDDREKDRAGERYHDWPKNSSGVRGAAGKPPPNLNEFHRQETKRKIAGLVDANRHYVEIISDEIKKASRRLDDSFSALEQSQDLRARVMENAILANAQLERLTDSAQAYVNALEILRNLLATLDEIGERALRVRSVAADVDLLAANAGVDASRLGEIGRGFSGFAERMQRFSRAGSEAITDINDLVARTRDDLEKSIRILERNCLPREPANEVRTAGFNELENELADLDQLTTQAAANLEPTLKALQEIEHKVNALSDSLSNGVAEMFEKPEKISANSFP
ncbi:MAG: methyl-accepting chemotaxis protein [Gammaproteobacteria bacterium]